MHIPVKVRLKSLLVCLVTAGVLAGCNLGAYGDAGAVVTGDEGTAARVRMLGDHGSGEKHRHDFPGVNSRLVSLISLSRSCRKMHAIAATSHLGFKKTN